MEVALPRQKYVNYRGKQVETFPIQMASAMGYSFGHTDAQIEENFVPQSSFSLHPSHHIRSADQSTAFKVSFAISGRTSTVALQSFRMFNLRYVLTTLASQHQDEVIHASHLAQEDFQTILKSMMQPFHDKMSATPSYQWPGRLQRQPVRLIGLQTQLLPSKPSELKEEHLEWCYNSADGVRGIRGKVLKRPQTTFHGPTLAGVEEHFYEESGLLGFKRFFDSPFASEESDLAYLERVGGGGLVAVWSFFAPLIRLLLGQQPTVVMYSAPGWGKTTLLTHALKMVSRMSRLCSNQTTAAGIRMLGSISTELIVLDDNDKKSLEEVLALTTFQNTMTVNKKDGVIASCAPQAITTNLMHDRSKRFSTGRLVQYCKLTKSYQDPRSALCAVDDALGLVEAQNSTEQPLQFLMTCASVFFEKVDLPTEHESEARDLKFISEDGKQIKKFHLWLVKAMMALQLIVPDMSMRENMSYSQIFCWVFLLDEVFAGDLESDWVLRGGSSAFFSVYVTALMRVLWGETQEEKEEEEKEEEVGGHEGAFTEITNFFFDLANKIQLRPGYRTESPGEEVHEVRLHRQLSGQFLIWCKSTVNFHNKFGTRRDILEFKSLFQVHGKMRSKIPPYGPFAKTLHGWALPMSVLPLPLQEKLGATLWRSSIHNSLLQFIQRQQEDVGGPSDSFSLRLSETDAEPAEVTLPGHADIDDEFLGSSQAGELEMISPTRITRSNSAREGAALIERLALESKTGADLGVAPKLSNSKNGDGRNEGLSWEHGQHEGSKDGQHGNSSSPEISCTER